MYEVSLGLDYLKVITTVANNDFDISVLDGSSIFLQPSV